MKKLITAAVASAFAFLAIGAVNAVDLPSGTSVESYTGALLTDKDDAGTGSDSTYWFLQGDDQAELLVTNYVGEAPSPRPEQFTGDNNNYLKIDTTGRLYRSIGINDQTTTFGNTVDIGDGIYLDTLVQFTAADDQFKDGAITAGDKIAISYVERDADSVDEGEDPYTNFVVRAAYVDAVNSRIVETNYFLTFPDQPANEVQFDKDAWHRLTVRAISNVGNADAPVGFVVYVDGTNLVYKAGVSGGSVVAGDEAYVESLNSVVKTYLYKEGNYALLPSLMTSDDIGYDALAAVAFNGNGCVDDISFTATKPGILPSEGMTVTIAWDDNVASYTVVAGETTLVDGEVVSGEGSTNLLLSAGITAITVTATYVQDPVKYEAGKWSVSAGTLNNGVWTFENGATLTIKSMEPLFDVGGVHYGSFEDALAAAVTAGTSGSPATIKLLADFVGTASQSALTFSTGYIVLDLNGKTVQGLDSDYSVANFGASLTIIDSASGGTIAVPQMSDPEQFAVGSLLVSGDTAITVIRAGIFEGVITVVTNEEQPTNVFTVYGGQFYDPDYNEEDSESAFYLVAYAGEYNFLPEGVTYNYDGGNYFTVSSGEPPAPTTYELTIPTVTGASATVTDKATSSEIADLTAIEDGTVVTVTWTPDSGYKITAGATEEITMDDDKTAKSPTVSAITYATLTITQVANCTIVVSNATAEVASGAKFDVDDATQLTVYRTPAEGYELDNCAATETITMDQDQTVTAAVKQSGGDYPSYIDDNVAYKDAYDQWKTENSVAAGDNQYVDAFLLNIAPNAADQTLEPASITISGSTITIAANKDLKGVNGKVYIKTAGTLAGLESASWGVATLNETTGAIEMTSNGTAAFFKIKVDF